MRFVTELWKFARILVVAVVAVAVLIATIDVTTIIDIVPVLCLYTFKVSGLSQAVSGSGLSAVWMMVWVSSSTGLLLTC